MGHTAKAIVRRNGATERQIHTASARKHRFESFSQRIAKIKIDPVRRKRKQGPLDHEDRITFSHFRHSLEEWRELNLSSGFVEFYRQVEPLSGSLPQLLHHQDLIVDLLMKYVDKREALSMEPLLNLTSHLAHDLGERFEKHFARIVSQVSQIAATHSDLDVIEWSFNCLAWLFKYLSRLLVPDLRPLYDLFSPLIGRTSQKPFVARFAAEALSFLLRRAAVLYEKDSEPLEKIVWHVLKDLEQCPGDRVDFYRQGMTNLFVSSIKGVAGGIHSAGRTVLKLIVNCTFSSLHFSSVQKLSNAEPLLESILISLAQSTTTEEFEPLLDETLSTIGSLENEPTEEQLRVAPRILFVLIAVRGESRIENWEGILKRVQHLVNLLNAHEKLAGRFTVSHLLAIIAFCFQYAPLNVVIPYLSLLDTVSSNFWDASFLQFCTFFADMGHDRFRNLLLPHLERFIASQWSRYGSELSALLPHLSSAQCLRQDISICPFSWQEEILRGFESFSCTSDVELPNERVHDSFGYVQLFQVLPTNVEVKKRLCNTLLRLCLAVIAESNKHHPTARDLLAIGSGLRFVLRNCQIGTVDNSVWVSLCEAAVRFGDCLAFWDSVLDLLSMESLTLDTDGPHISILVDAILAPLASSSHELRLVSLKTLEALLMRNEHSVPDVLRIAILIEETPINIQSARSLSMHVRRLAQSYKESPSHYALFKAIPAYCFGLLHFQLSQIWEDACDALKAISNTKEIEDLILDHAINWISYSGLETALGADADVILDSEMRVPASSNQPPRLIELQEKLRLSVLNFENPGAVLQKQFCLRHSQVPLLNASCRMQGLRVLHSLPKAAERRSRLLVPILLQSALPDEADTEGNIDLEGGIPSQYGETVKALKWTRKDYKSLWALFGKFNNPRVLYQSDAVHDAMLQLLANGDADIQKLALEAILTWKTPGVNKYSDHLLGLLDDSQFREEIDAFTDDDQAAILPEHRPELNPILLRLLYGKATARGSAGGKRGQQTRRRAVLIALPRLGEDETKIFLQISLGPLDGLQLLKNGQIDKVSLSDERLSLRKQLGLVKMIKDMLEVISKQLTPYAYQLADATLYCLLKVSLNPDNFLSTSTERSELSQQSSLHKTIRQVGFQCLSLLFDKYQMLDWRPYCCIIMKELLEPRLEKLPVENAQSVSGLLRLISTWCRSVSTAEFVLEDENLAARVADCVTTPFAHPDVKIFVLKEIMLKLIESIHEGNSAMSATVPGRSRETWNQMVEHCAVMFLDRIGVLLRQNPNKEILQTSVQVVAELAPLISQPSNYRSIVETTVFLLELPLKKVSASTKSNLLRILERFVATMRLADDELGHTCYIVVSELYAFFNDRTNRDLLGKTLRLLSSHDVAMLETVALCEDLNAFSLGKVDERDFDRRLNAFSTINEVKYARLSAMQWRPIICSMLFFIQDEEELAIRANASFCLRRFIETAAAKESTELAESKSLITKLILPALYSGARAKSEVIRAEYLTVMAHLVRSFPAWPIVSDMHVLLVGGDEEANFFVNILHLQNHRRLRALRRLSNVARSGILSGDCISSFLIPLLEHFILEKPEESAAHNLSGEAVQTIGALAEWVEWRHFRTLLARFVGYLQHKPELERTTIKLLDAMVGALSRAHQARSPIADPSSRPSTPPSVPEVKSESSKLSKLSETLPDQGRVSVDLTKGFLPFLTSYLHLKDESTVSFRVQIAKSIVRMLLLLPQVEITQRLPTVLLDLSHILRSRSQESRDLTRATLAEVSLLLGPQYFGEVIKELRVALQRGSQLHVLAFTVHSLLVAVAESFKPGTLDYCLSEVIAVAMDDIFGTTGTEKDAEDYVSKMREVKSHKSYDSMELLAKMSSLHHLIHIINPVRDLLLQRLDGKMIKKADELLRRLGLGILRNEAAKDRDILMFAYELIQDVYRHGERHNDGSKQSKSQKYITGVDNLAAQDRHSSFLYKLKRLSLDILRSVLQKESSLRNATNLAGFLPFIGDSLADQQEEVQLSTIRLLSVIIAVPLPELSRNAPVYLSEAVRLIKGAPSMDTEIVPASLKLIAGIFRELQDVAVNEKDMAYLLKRIRPELEQPDRQGAMFKFLRAVLGLKIMIPEVYDVLDGVASIMITNHMRSTRDLARGTYFQFLMEYPQSKARFEKQVVFLVKNLDYEHVEGRQSVMEALHLLLTKSGESLVQEILETLFAPLVLVVINDESSECREMAAALIRKIFEKADTDRLKSFTTLLRSWSEQGENQTLRRGAIQCLTFYFEAREPHVKDVHFLCGCILNILSEGVRPGHAGDWELIYFALQAFDHICKVSRLVAFAPSSSELWCCIRKLLGYPHAWVKLSAARLVGRLLSESVHKSSEEAALELPLRASAGLELHTRESLHIAQSSLRVLKSPILGDELANQTVKNLVFLGRCFSANATQWVERTAEADLSSLSLPEEHEESDEEGSLVSETNSSQKTALQYMFKQLSRSIRRHTATSKDQNLKAKMAALQLLGALCTALPISSLSSSLEDILLPLQIITDTKPSAPKSDDPNAEREHRNFFELSEEIATVLQEKLGTTQYVRIIQNIRDELKGKREERRVKRRILAVEMPEKFEERKRRKHEATRQKRKEKALEARGRRRGW